MASTSRLSKHPAFKDHDRRLRLAWRRFDRSTAYYAQPFDPAACQAAWDAYIAIVDTQERPWTASITST